MVVAAPEADSAYEFGRMVGMGVGILIPLTSLVHALRRRSEEENSVSCATALVCSSSAWLLASVAYALTQWSEGLAWIRVPSTLGVLVLTIAGVVLGIRGLRELSGSEGVTGRGQAAGALVIAGILSVAFAFGVVRGLEGEDLPKDWKVAQKAPGTTLRVESKNCSFVVPPKEWVQVDPQKLNPRADLAFVHPRKKLFYLLIGVAAPPGVTISNDLLADAGRGDLQRMDPNARTTANEAVSAGSLQGVAFNGEAQVGGKPVFYRYWAGVSRSHLYNLVIYGPKEHQALLSAEAGRLLGGFRLLQP